MSDDLAQRLRDDYEKTVPLCAEAADEIQRLRADLTEAAIVEARLREALEGWQSWWELPWEAKRPDVAQLRYNRARAVLAETK